MKNVRILHRADGVAEKRRPAILKETDQENREKGFSGILKYRCLHLQKEKRIVTARDW